MTDRILYRCVARHSTRTPAAAAGLLLAAGLTLWIAAPRTGLWALVRLAAVGAITGGLYITVRWLAREYIYTLEQQDNGQIDFVVTEQNGRRQITVCRVSADTLTELRPLAKGERIPKPTKNRRVYHYCADLRPANAALLTLRDGDGEAILHFAPDDGLFRLLAERIPTADSGDEKS